MATTATQEVIIFSASDERDTHRQAKALKSALAKAGVKVRVIDKLSNDLDDLLLVAKYHIIEVPTTVLLDNEVECYREVGTLATPRDCLAQLRELR